MNTAPGTLRASADEPQPALLAPENLAEVGPSLLETRIGPSGFLGETRTEPLSFVSGTSNRAYRDSPAEIAMGSSGPSIDEPLAVYRGGALTYFVTDALGSVVAENGATGTIGRSTIFDAWGVTRSETGTRLSPFTYTGREVGEAGLLFYRARYLQPSIGRLTQEDPLGSDSIQPSLYAYVRNTPTRFLDPSGLSGTLKIHASGKSGSLDGMASGHGWIEFTKDGGGTTTYSTWGNNPRFRGNGLLDDEEAYRQYKDGQATRTVHLNDEQERRLMKLIEIYRRQGAWGWTLKDNCSKFARDAWLAATGEDLNAYYESGYHTPTTLRDSILEANKKGPPKLR